MIDFYGFFGSVPVGFNHPHFDKPEVQEELLRAAKVKVANADVYTVQYATFVETFARVVRPQAARKGTSSSKAARWRWRTALKAAMDWKVRKNLAAGCGGRGTEIIHFERAFHGRTRLHAEPDEH